MLSNLSKTFVALLAVYATSASTKPLQRRDDAVTVYLDILMVPAAGKGLKVALPDAIVAAVEMDLEERLFAYFGDTPVFSAPSYVTMTSNNTATMVDTVSVLGVAGAGVKYYFTDNLFARAGVEVDYTLDDGKWDYSALVGLGVNFGGND